MHTEGDLSPIREVSANCSLSEGSDWVGAVDGWRQAYLQVFRAREREWEALTGFASIFAAKGVGSLLQAYGYYSVSQYWTGSRLSSWIVGILVVTVHAILALAFQAWKRSKCKPYLVVLEIVMILLPHFTCLASIHFVRVAKICIPVTFLCHFVTSCIACHQIWSSEPEDTRSTSVDSADSRRDNTENIKLARRLCLAGGAVVVLFWLFCLLWASADVFDGDHDYFITGLQSDGGRKLRGAASAGTVGPELDALLASRGLSGAISTGMRGALSRLGVRRQEDLQWIHEEDLLRMGLTLVDSRKLLSA